MYFPTGQRIYRTKGTSSHLAHAAFLHTILWVLSSWSFLRKPSLYPCWAYPERVMLCLRDGDLKGGWVQFGHSVYGAPTAACEVPCDMDGAKSHGWLSSSDIIPAQNSGV